MRKPLSLLAIAAALSACGGDGGGTQDLPLATLPTAAAAAVAGDWAIPSGSARAVAARNATEWQALWAERRSQLDCSLSFNQAACAAATAPAIDFASYDVVGVALRSDCSFDTPLPRRVFLDFGAGRLVVELAYVCVFRVPLLPQSTKTMFFLVPKSTLAVELRGQEL